MSWEDIKRAEALRSGRGLSDAQWRILQKAKERGSLRVKATSRKSVEALEAAGLGKVDVEAVPDGGRVRLVYTFTPISAADRGVQDQ